MPKFSIIVPVYNTEKYLRKCLDSIKNQTFNDYEVIIINDGSTDNSLSIVSAINDIRIKIYSKSNGGVSAARNDGIIHSVGDYILFLDADDIFLETHSPALSAPVLFQDIEF